MKRPRPLNYKWSHPYVVAMSDALDQLGRLAIRKKALRPGDVLLFQATWTGSLDAAEVHVRVATQAGSPLERAAVKALTLVAQQAAKRQAKKKPRIPKTVEGLLRKWEPKKK